MENNIFVIDVDVLKALSLNMSCQCGSRAEFIVGLAGFEFHMCNHCMAELGKRIIDGLC